MSVPATSVTQTSVPAALKYTKEHEWARDDNGQVVVGITSFAADQLGSVVYVELPKVGTRVAAGAVFGQVESTKSVSDLYAPVAGEVVAVNDALDGSPELVNDSPYGDGWMIGIRPDDAGWAAGLLDADAYAALIG